MILSIIASNEQTQFILNYLEEFDSLEFSKIIIAIEDDEEDLKDVNYEFKDDILESQFISKISWKDVHYTMISQPLKDLNNLKDILNTKYNILDLKGITSFLKDVPILIPGYSNFENINSKMISLPNPLVSQFILSLYSQCNLQNLKSIQLVNLIPTIYSSDEAPKKLIEQTVKKLNGEALEDDEESIAFNIRPISDISKHNSIFLDQIEKIGVLPNIEINIQSINCPTTYHLSQQISLEYFEEPLENSKQNSTSYTEIYPTYKELAENALGYDSAKLSLSLLEDNDLTKIYWSTADIQRFNIAYLGVWLLNILDNFR